MGIQFTFNHREKIESVAGACFCLQNTDSEQFWFRPVVSLSSADLHCIADDAVPECTFCTGTGIDPDADTPDDPLSVSVHFGHGVAITKSLGIDPAGGTIGLDALAVRFMVLRSVPGRIRDALHDAQDDVTSIIRCLGGRVMSAGSFDVETTSARLERLFHAANRARELGADTMTWG
jgi:hypothetical protein